MTNEIQFWVQTALTTIAIAIYLGLFIYQKSMIKRIKEHLDVLDKSITSYKKLVNVDDFKKHVDLKMETTIAEQQKIREEELQLLAEKFRTEEIPKISEDMIVSFTKILNDLLPFTGAHLDYMMRKFDSEPKDFKKVLAKNLPNCPQFIHDSLFKTHLLVEEEIQVKNKKL